MFADRQRGMTLIEMIVAIVIIGVGLAGVLAAFNQVVFRSADPLVAKQMVTVAEGLMEEILLKPFAIANAPPANASAACGSATSVRNAFDDVRDYGGYTTTGICDIDGVAVAGLETYNVAVQVACNQTLGVPAVPVPDVCRIVVTVTRGADNFVLTGWRTNYARW